MHDRLWIFSGQGLANAGDFDGNAPVGLQALNQRWAGEGIGAVAHRVFFPYATDLRVASFDTQRLQVRQHRSGAIIGEPVVVGRAAQAIGVSGNGNMLNDLGLTTTWSSSSV